MKSRLGERPGGSEHGPTPPCCHGNRPSQLPQTEGSEGARILAHFPSHMCFIWYTTFKRKLLRRISQIYSVFNETWKTLPINNLLTSDNYIVSSAHENTHSTSNWSRCLPFRGDKIANEQTFTKRHCFLSSRQRFVGL